MNHLKQLEKLFPFILFRIEQHSFNQYFILLNYSKGCYLEYNNYSWWINNYKAKWYTFNEMLDNFIGGLIYKNYY